MDRIRYIHEIRSIIVRAKRSAYANEHRHSMCRRYDKSKQRRWTIQPTISGVKSYPKLGPLGAKEYVDEFDYPLDIGMSIDD